MFHFGTFPDKNVRRLLSDTWTIVPLQSHSQYFVAEMRLKLSRSLQHVVEPFSKRTTGLRTSPGLPSVAYLAESLRYEVLCQIIDFAN